MKKTVSLKRLLISLSILICTLQLYHYPILKDETIVKWWQIKILKEIGAVVGLLPFLLSAFTTRFFETGFAFWALAYSYAALWAFMVYWLLGLVARMFQNKNRA